MEVVDSMEEKNHRDQFRVLISRFFEMLQDHPEFLLQEKGSFAEDRLLT